MFRLAHRRAASRYGFPRARGDVPLFNRLTSPIPEFSPRTRGCSAFGKFRLGVADVFPACAGMFRSLLASARPTLCFPRVRGDVPHRKWPWRSRKVFSPRARGCSCFTTAGGEISQVFPACAGMFRATPGRRQDSLGFPRVRGDVPYWGGDKAAVIEFSPHARGCSQLPVPASEDHTVFPRTRGCSEEDLEQAQCHLVFSACAGMFPTLPRWGSGGHCFPRVRGDVPAHKTDTLFVGEFSPQARRSSTTKNLEFFHWGILPAQTGTFR